MPENRGCCQCCCSFITTLGLTAFFLWLSLRASNPKCYIERFYIPALNNTLNSYKSNTTTTTTTTTPSNATIYFNLKLANPNKDKGVYYDAINLTILYLPPNATATATATAVAAVDGGNYSVIGNKTIPGFHQGHKKTAHRKDQSVEPGGVDWKAVYGAVLNNKTVVYRVNLTTKVRFKIIFWKTKRYKINVGANVEVNDLGIKVNKKAIRLKSGAPQLGCYRAHVVGALVMLFSFFIF